MKKNILFIVAYLLASQVLWCQSQNISIEAYPIIGNNTTIPLMKNKSFSWDNAHIRKLVPSNCFVSGLGLNAKLVNDWTLSLEYISTYVGGGYYFEMRNADGFLKHSGKSISGAITNVVSLNTERKIFDFGKFKTRHKYNYFRLSGLLGASILWMPWYQRDDRISKSSFGTGSVIGQNTIHEVIETTRANRNQIGTINTGLTLQWFHNFNPKVKIVAYYSYGFNGLYENIDEHTFYGTEKESYTYHSGNHMITLAAQWPIVLYRNKTQKEWLKDQRKYGYY